jgi:hypothetical protein
VSSALEGKSFLAFADYVSCGPMRVNYGSIAYLALIEAEGQISYLVLVALGDRVPTGPLFALDANARTFYNKTIFLIAEAAHEDM